jgi:hypothetical protein
MFVLQDIYSAIFPKPTSLHVCTCLCSQHTNNFWAAPLGQRLEGVMQKNFDGGAME